MTYAQQSGLTNADFRELDLKDPKQKKVYASATAGIPMNISLAELMKVDQ